MPQLCIKLSSMMVWVYPKGKLTEKPIRAFSDIVGRVFVVDKKIETEWNGETPNLNLPIEYHKRAKIMIRQFFDGPPVNPEPFYGKLLPLDKPLYK